MYSRLSCASQQRVYKDNVTKAVLKMYKNVKIILKIIELDMDRKRIVPFKEFPEVGIIIFETQGCQP